MAASCHAFQHGAQQLRLAGRRRVLLRHSGQRAGFVAVALSRAVVFLLVADQAFQRADLAAQPLERLGVGDDSVSPKPAVELLKLCCRLWVIP